MDLQAQTDMETLAKYPFLKAAREYVSSLKLNLSEIQKHPLYSASIDLGRERVCEFGGYVTVHRLVYALSSKVYGCRV